MRVGGRGRPQCHVEKGNDFVTTVYFASTKDRASLLQSFPLNPRTIFDAGNVADGWLTKMSRLYEKFRFRKLVFHYTPQVGTTTNAGLFMCADNDVDDNFTGLAGAPLLSRVRSMKHSVFFPAYGDSAQKGVTIKITDPTFFNSVLYTDPNLDSDRWAYAGVFHVGCTGPVTGGVQFGLISMDYEIEFTSPNVEGGGAGSGQSGAKATSADGMGHVYPFGTTWIPGSGGTAPWSNIPVTLVTTVPGTSINASCFLFDSPGVYQVTWEHNGTALNTTVPVMVGSASLTQTSYAATFNTSTREMGVIFLSIANSGDGFYATHAAGPTLSSIKIWINETPLTPVALPTPLTRSELQTAEKLSALLRRFAKVNDSSEDESRRNRFSRSQADDVIDAVDLEISTTSSGTISPPGGVPVPFSQTTTGSITGTIESPDPAMGRSQFIRHLIQNPEIAETMAKGFRIDTQATRV